jgi:hypothetical protein
VSENTIDWASLHQDSTTTLEGEFPVVIVEATATKTNDQSKDMIKWKAKVESGPYAGRPLWGNFTISPESPGAMRILFSHLAVLGLDGAFFAANQHAPVAVIAQALVGRKAVAEVGTRSWNGTEREEVKAWKPALGGPGGGTSLGVLGGLTGGGGSSLGGTPVAPSAGVSPAPKAAQSPVSGPSVSAATTPAVSEVTSSEPSTPAPELPF